MGFVGPQYPCGPKASSHSYIGTRSKYLSIIFNCTVHVLLFTLYSTVRFLCKNHHLQLPLASPSP